MNDVFNNLKRVGASLSMFGGINFILLAIAIFIYPQIVAYAIAAILLILGLGMLGFSTRMRKRSKNSQYTETYFFTQR
ncbi:MAG: hypothetical protein KDC92_08920 [Bacteroidetes bacterium]|nr:hypothetical protein [Bacteroidota bacterium]